MRSGNYPSGSEREAASGRGKRERTEEAHVLRDLAGAQRAWSSGRREGRGSLVWTLPWKGCGTVC